MTVERPDWSDTPAEITPAPAAPIASPDADEDEVLTRSRQLLATGHFAPDEVQRLYFLTDDELAEVTKPRPKAPTRATVNAELAAIAETRRSDKSAYFGDEALQARERELIELREQLKADRTAADAKPAGEDIEAELAKIAKLRREDRRAYDRTRRCRPVNASSWPPVRTQRNSRGKPSRRSRSCRPSSPLFRMPRRSRPASHQCSRRSPLRINRPSGTNCKRRRLTRAVLRMMPTFGASRARPKARNA